MLRIRLSMGGVRKRPIYKIVVADGRYPRDGKFIEKVGSYNPLLPKEKKERIKVEFERIKYWISKGAQPTLRVSRILGEMKLMPMPKPGNNPLKAVPKKDRKKKEEPKKAEAKKEEPKKEEPKKEEPKKAEAKKEEPKKAEAKKEEPKKEEPKKEEPKKAEAKKEEPKKEEPKKAEAKKDEPKA
jgi:small subunit ribosomal protein S16